MDGNDFGHGWIAQVRLSHGSAAGEIAQRLLVSFPAFINSFAQIVAKNWPDLERAELHGQELSLLPAPPLDFVFRHRHDITVADLAQLLLDHTSLGSSLESPSSDPAKSCIYSIYFIYHVTRTRTLLADLKDA